MIRSLRFALATLLANSKLSLVSALSLSALSVFSAPFTDEALAFPFPQVGKPVQMRAGMQWTYDTANDPWKRDGYAAFFISPDLRGLPSNEQNQENFAFVSSVIRSSAAQIFNELNGSLWWANRTKLYLADSSGLVDPSLILKAFPESLPTDAQPTEKVFDRYLSASPQLFLSSRSLLVVGYKFSSNPQILERNIRAAVKAAIVVSLGIGNQNMSFSYKETSPILSASEASFIKRYDLGSQWISGLRAGGYDTSKVRQSIVWRNTLPIALSSSAVKDSDVTLFWEGVIRPNDGSYLPSKASSLAKPLELPPAFSGAELPKAKAICGGIDSTGTGSNILFVFKDPRFSEEVSATIFVNGDTGYAYSQQLARFLSFAKSSPACAAKVIKACIWNDWLPQKSSRGPGPQPAGRSIEPVAFAPLSFDRDSCTQEPTADFPAADYLYL